MQLSFITDRGTMNWQEFRRTVAQRKKSAWDKCQASKAEKYDYAFPAEPCPPLAPPYSFDELRSVCLEKQMSLPVFLVHYLVKGAREFVDEYGAHMALTINTFPSPEMRCQGVLPHDMTIAPNDAISAEIMDCMWPLSHYESDRLSYSTYLYLGQGRHYGTVWMRNHTDKTTAFIVPTFEKYVSQVEQRALGRPV